MYFKEVVGQESLKNTLRNVVDSGHVSHALMFSGPEGSGNLPLALAFAGYVFCKNRNDADRCGACAPCKQMDQLSHPDIHFSFPFVKKEKIQISETLQRDFKSFLKSNPYASLKDWEVETAGENKKAIIPAKESEEIIKKLSLKSFAGGYKIMLIWMPERLNATASNRLLKTLEEPSPRTIIILVPNQPDDLLPTIISRVQLMKCAPLTDSQIINALISRYNVESEVAENAARMSEGNFNMALTFSQKETRKDPYFELFQEWMRTCVAPGKHDLLSVSEKIASFSRDEQKYFLEYCLNFLHETIIHEYIGKENARYSKEAAGFALKFAPYMVERDLEAFHNVLSRGHALVDRNVNANLLYLKLSAEMIRIFNQKTPESIS